MPSCRTVAPVRIVHVSDCYLPRTGGIETQVRALALQQRERGAEVAVITATSAGPSTGLTGLDGIRVDRISMRLPGDLPVHPRAGVHLRRALADLRPDVVHVHLGVVSPFAWSAIRTATRLGLPTVITIHCVWGALARSLYRGADVLLRWSRWPAELTAVSGVAADRVRRGMTSSRSVTVIPNGIDPLLWPVVPVVPHEYVVAVSVMRLAPRKRLEALLRIVGRVNALGLGLRAVIIGDGPLRRRAQRYVARQGIPVTFTGRLTADQIQQVFARADVFVQPSVKEAFGLAALEARTCGLPVVIRSQSGSTEFIRDRVNGFVTASDGDMAAVLSRIAANPAELAMVRAHNAGTPPESTWPGVLDRLNGVYRRAGAIAERARG